MNTIMNLRVPYHVLKWKTKEPSFSCYTEKLETWFLKCSTCLKLEAGIADLYVCRQFETSHLLDLGAIRFRCEDLTT